jgi:pimeloyl-ACP methyl ester carboxylesterase
VNGLAIPEGVEDVRDLADILRDAAASAFPDVGVVPVLVAGASEGGAVATHVAERFPGVFQGVLSTCGPTGSFQEQIDYLGHFNVLFDYFFPEVFADGNGGSLVTPVGVSSMVISDWPAYSARASAAVAADPGTASELLNVADVPVNAEDPTSGGRAILGILWYNVFATNDGIAKLGGSPFGNTGHWYRGSTDDQALNGGVRRYEADLAARQTVAERYETTGAVAMPYVSMHTTGDPIVPFEQQSLYQLKALSAGALFGASAVTVSRYGHCNFAPSDLSAGLALLLQKIEGTPFTDLTAAVPTRFLR